MSVQLLFWNAQGIGNPSTLSHLHNLICLHSLSIIAVLEPMVTPDVGFLSRRLGLSFVAANCTNKIWFFADSHYSIDVIEDFEQALHIRVVGPLFSEPLFISAVYAKCSKLERRPLWDNLRQHAIMIEGCPWIVGGDFNIFIVEEERDGSSNNRHLEMIDFADAISDSQLVDPGFDGPLFIWARGNLRERLDRILLGESWTSVFATTRVTHLPRVQSDHSPLLVKCSFSLRVSRPSFRFQNMWTKHHGFVDEVVSAWAAPTDFSGMLNLQFKLARTKKQLKVWNKLHFGDIFQKVRDADAEVSKAQILFDSHQTADCRANLNRKIAEYVLCTRMEEDFWKQKAAVRWAAEGERNTKFFQGWVKQKRCKSRIHCIQEVDRVLTQEDDIRDSAVNFFHDLLSSDIEHLEEPDLDCLHSLPASVDKDAVPTFLHLKLLAIERGHSSIIS